MGELYGFDLFGVCDDEKWGAFTEPSAVATITRQWCVACQRDAAGWMSDTKDSFECMHGHRTDRVEIMTRSSTGGSSNAQWSPAQSVKEGVNQAARDILEHRDAVRARRGAGGVQWSLCEKDLNDLEPLRHEFTAEEDKAFESIHPRIRRDCRHPENLDAMECMLEAHLRDRVAYEKAHAAWEQRQKCECSARGEVGRREGWGHSPWCPACEESDG